MGLRTADADLTRGLRAVGSSRRTVTEQYTMTTGKRRARANQLTELRLAFAGAGGARLDLVVRAAPDGGYPSLFQVGNDFVLLTESDVDGRYSGSRLRHAAGSPTYQVELADTQVSATGELRTPWRTVIVGDLAGVTTSTLVDDLAPPARFADTSWIRPGKVAWSWLSEHSSPSDFERQKQYVDFAARNGWPYSLVDEGWSAAWVPELVRYARARGAEQRLMVNFHGSTIPHGLARTWPHIMTMEGVRGAENFPPAGNNPAQAFTRNVVGSMDYTPVSLEVGTREATVAHEVALPVAYESGWTHFADRPEAYQRFPQALRFLNQLPTVWDETQLVSGNPGEHAILARRNGSRWFLGAIATGGAQTLTAPLRFLGVRSSETGPTGRTPAATATR